MPWRRPVNAGICFEIHVFKCQRIGQMLLELDEMCVASFSGLNPGVSHKLQAFDEQPWWNTARGTVLQTRSLFCLF